MALSDYTPEQDRGVQLYPEVVEAIRQFIFSDAWERFYKPALHNMRSEWVNKLMDADTKRKNEHPDDYIRGCVATIDVFLRMPESVIADYDADQERKNRERAETGEYRVRSDSGYLGP